MSQPHGDVRLNIGPFHVSSLNPCIISNVFHELDLEKASNSHLGPNAALGIIIPQTQGEIQTRREKEKVGKQHKRKCIQLSILNNHLSKTDRSNLHKKVNCSCRKLRNRKIVTISQSQTRNSCGHTTGVPHEPSSTSNFSWDSVLYSELISATRKVI